ncbi:DUF6941 family protein [Methylobacterium nodulans]|uniref:DUF6941 family protein n=1 Tax=Methylobacterium nodulans TaxID=114616 RepID=UPI0012EE67E4|nr:hypothetical protein [Methylobacterium nodulans]
MSTTGPFVRAALLADDVRTEVTGKHIIIGTYGSDIGVPQFPAGLRFRLILVIEFGDHKKYELKVRLLGPSGDEFAKFDAELEVEKPRTTQVIPTIGFAIPFSSEGSFRVECFEEGEWKSVGIWNVAKADIPVPQLGA